MKKFLVCIQTILITIAMLLVASSSSFAAQSVELRLEMLRSSGYGYKAHEKNIWKISPVDSSNSTFYCIKAGPGFGSSDMGGASKLENKTYYYVGDMKDRSTISNTYKYALPQNEEDYNAVLWILNHAYIPAETGATTEEQQNALVRKIKLLLFTNDLTTDDLQSERFQSILQAVSDDEIDAVQQAAIWYFTNSESNVYHQVDISLWTNRVINVDGDYTSLENAFRKR